MIGPFQSIPFKNSPVAISPLSMRHKKDSKTRRIIMDCSWLIGASLNDAISKTHYQGEVIRLTYPIVDDLARRIHELSSSGSSPVFLFKEDLDRAFRQIFACPKSVPYLGFRWRGVYYFDLVLMMGCHIAPYICQRVIDMVRYLHNSMGYFLLNYVDDFVGAEYLEHINSSQHALVRLLRDVGIQRSERKSVKPTQNMDFVGNLFDTCNMTIGVTPEQKVDILRELEGWRTCKVCTRKQLESLIGKLQFMSNCIRPGRLFVSRLLVEIRGMECSRCYYISNEMRKDIKWWYMFLPSFSGSSILWLLDIVEVDTEMATDSCLERGGGISGNEVFSVEFPKYVKRGAHIRHLELWSLILAVKLWGKHMTGKVVRMKTDNEAVVVIVNTGRSSDLKLQKLLRELVWWLATYEFKIKGVYIPSKSNQIPDLLSRWHEGLEVRDHFWELTSNQNIKWKNVYATLFKFTHDW